MTTIFKQTYTITREQLDAELEARRRATAEGAAILDALRQPVPAELALGYLCGLVARQRQLRRDEERDALFLHELERAVQALAGRGAALS